MLCFAVVVMVQGSMSLLAAAEESPGAGTTVPCPICFSNVCLKKGMPQAEVIHELTAGFRLVHLNGSQAVDPDSSSSEDSYIVKDALNTGSTVGVISFADHRLSWASKAWGYTDDQKAGAVAATWYSLIESLTKERGPAASVETKHSVQGSVSVDQIKIIFGSKEALITILKQKEPNGDWATGEVHVDEAMKEESNP